MYEAANKSGKVDSSHLGTAMSSQNQGNPTCWSDPDYANANIDCAPDQVCDTKDFSKLGFPTGVGVCVYKKNATPPGDTGGLAPETNCGAGAVQGAACGGYYSNYTDALGYTCQSVTINSGGHVNQSTMACLPDMVAGLGIYETPISSGAPLYTGTGSELNPEWQAAAQWATGNGTTPGLPFYEYFSKACPRAYAWTYDDNAGGLSCNSSAPGGKNKNVSFTIEFGPKSEPPEPTPTATATPSPTPTPTSTPTPTPTPTPDPSGVHCTPNVYLSTNPAGTLAFGDVQVGKSVTLPLMVMNNEPAGTLNLTAKIRNREAEDFAVTGGTCTTGKKLNAGETCTYTLKLKGDTLDPGAAVSTDFVVTGSFGPGVCPGGDIQSV
jgi:hypothetical protein